MPLRIKVAHSDSEVAQVFDLRARCSESGAPTVDLVDAYPTSFHVVVLLDHAVIASLRVASLSALGSVQQEQDAMFNTVDVGPNVQPYVLGRICVDPSHRDEKTVRHLLSKAVIWSRARGATHILARFEPWIASIAVGEGFHRRSEAEEAGPKSGLDEPYLLEVSDVPVHLAAIGDFGEIELGDPLERVVYDRGEQIIKQAERGYCAYVLTRGVADVVVEGHGDTETPIAALGVGALFGELALLADTRRSATVRARRECEVLRVTPAAFRNFIRENQGNAEKVISLLSSRQQAQLAGLVGPSPTDEQRLAHARSRAPGANKESSDYQSLLRGRSSNTVLFGEKEMDFWLDLYKSIADEYGLKNPFFAHTHNTGEFSQYSLDSFIKSDVDALGEIGFLSGPLSAFSPQFLTTFVASQLTAYVDRGALGTLPRQVAYMRDLTAAHIDGFDATDQLITFVSKNSEGQLCPLVGAKLVRGKSGRLVKDINGDATATLPTFRALRVIDPTFDSSEGGLKESDVVCLSSYFSADFRRLEVKQRSVLMLTELLIAMAGLVLEESCAQDQPPARRAVFDTHIDALVRKYQRDFGAVYTASGDEVVATPAVTDPQLLSGILRFHYGPREVGGYHGRIHVVTVDGDEYREASKKYLLRYQSRFKTGRVLQDT